MQGSDKPYKITVAWGSNAGGSFITDPIPVPSQILSDPNKASWSDGFPPNCWTALGYPEGEDFNGVNFVLSAWSRWLQAGGPNQWDSTFSASIGGYPRGALIKAGSLAGVFWLSLQDNNTTNPELLSASNSFWELCLIGQTELDNRYQAGGLYLKGEFVANFSGSPNALVCTIDAPLAVGMVVIGQPIATNTGATQLSVDGGSTFHTIRRGDAVGFAGGELINAQTAAFVWNGSIWQMISELPLSWYEDKFDDRYVPLNPQTNWYVNLALGTDAPGQGLSSGAGAFKTAQYAVDAVGRYIGQAGVVLNFADGAYGSITIASTGIGRWTILGNAGNHAAVSFSEFGSFGDFRAARAFGSTVEFKYVSFFSSDNNVGASNNANVTCTECVFEAPTNGVSFSAFALTGANITFQTSAVFSGNGGGFAGAKGGTLVFGYSTSGVGHLVFTSQGSPACSNAFVNVSGLGAMYSDPTYCQFVGGTVGNQYICDGNSVIQINGLVLPGTATVAPTHGGQVF